MPDSMSIFAFPFERFPPMLKSKRKYLPIKAEFHHEIRKESFPPHTWPRDTAR